MNSAATDMAPSPARLTPPVAVVGYGNQGRGDDGIGPWLAAWLARRLGPGPDWRILARRGLVPELLDELAGAGSIILLDATLEPLAQGWAWRPLCPDLSRAGHLTHEFSPGFLLGLLEMTQGWAPPAWLLCIKGDDFGLGRGLSPRARRRAGQAGRHLLQLLS